MMVRECDFVSDFDSISLTELQEEAAFMTRKDRKYLVPLDVLDAFLSDCDPATSVLDIDGRRTFAYQSAYIDDADLSAYHASRCRRANRYKVRTRHYIDSGGFFLEVKVRDGRGRTVKHRMARGKGNSQALAESERNWLKTFPFLTFRFASLDVQLQTSYQRTTLLLPEAAGRVTIDQRLAFSTPMGDQFDVSNMVVIETKGSGRPTPADQILWRLGYRPVSLSKYAVGMCVLHPDLPANRWNRLRRELLAI